KASGAGSRSSDLHSETAHVRSPGTAHARSHGAAHAPLRQPALVQAGNASRSTGTNGSTPDERKPKRAARAKGPSKNRLSAQAQAERDVEAAEAAMRALEDELADLAAWA